MTGPNENTRSGGLRKACDNCRLRKYKCSGERGGCARCVSDGDVCKYGVKEQMGRPRKGKAAPSAVAVIRGRGVEKPSRKKGGVNDKTSAAAHKRWEGAAVREKELSIRSVSSNQRSLHDGANSALLGADEFDDDNLLMALDSLQHDQSLESGTAKVLLSSDLPNPNAFYTHDAWGSTDIYMNDNNAYTIETAYDIPIPDGMLSPTGIAGSMAQTQKMRTKLAWKLNLPNLSRIDSFFGTNPFDSIYPSSQFGGQDFASGSTSRVGMLQDVEGGAAYQNFLNGNGVGSIPNTNIPQSPNQFSNPYIFTGGNTDGTQQSTQDGPLPFLPQAPEFSSLPTPLCNCAISFYGTYITLQHAVMVTAEQASQDLPGIFSQTLSLGVLSIATCRTLMECQVCFGKMPNILLMGTILPTTMMVYERTYCLITEPKGFPGAPDWTKGESSMPLNGSTPEEGGKMWRKIAVDALRRDMAQINAMAGDMIQTSIKAVMEVDKPKEWVHEVWARRTMEKRAKRAQSKAASKTASNGSVHSTGSSSYASSETTADDEGDREEGREARQEDGSEALEGEALPTSLEELERKDKDARKRFMRDAAFKARGNLERMGRRNHRKVLFPKILGDLGTDNNKSSSTAASLDMSTERRSISPHNEGISHGSSNLDESIDAEGESDHDEGNPHINTTRMDKYPPVSQTGDPHPAPSISDEDWVSRLDVMNSEVGGFNNALAYEELPACFRRIVAMKDQILLRTSGLELAFDTHNRFENQIVGVEDPRVSLMLLAAAGQQHREIEGHPSTTGVEGPGMASTSGSSSGLGEAGGVSGSGSGSLPSGLEGNVAMPNLSNAVLHHQQHHHHNHNQNKHHDHHQHQQHHHHQPIQNSQQIQQQFVGSMVQPCLGDHGRLWLQEALAVEFMEQGIPLPGSVTEAATGTSPTQAQVQEQLQQAHARVLAKAKDRLATNLKECGYFVMQSQIAALEEMGGGGEGGGGGGLGLGMNNGSGSAGSAGHHGHGNGHEHVHGHGGFHH